MGTCWKVTPMTLDPSRYPDNAVRQLLIARSALEAEQRRRDQRGEASIPSGRDVVRAWLDGGVEPVFLVAGFEILYVWLCQLAADSTRTSPVEVRQRVAIRTAQWAEESRGAGHELASSTTGGVRIDPYLAATEMIAYFNASSLDVNADERAGLLTSIWNGTQGRLRGLSVVIEGCLRAVEAPFELMLLGQVEAMLADRGERRDPALVTATVERSRLAGIKAVDAYITQRLHDGGNLVNEA